MSELMCFHILFNIPFYIPLANPISTNIKPPQTTTHQAIIRVNQVIFKLHQEGLEPSTN